MAFVPFGKSKSAPMKKGAAPAKGAKPMPMPFAKKGAKAAPMKKGAKC